MVADHQVQGDINWETSSLALNHSHDHLAVSAGDGVQVKATQKAHPRVSFPARTVGISQEVNIDCL